MKKNTNSGFSLVSVLVGTFVLSVSIIAILTFVNSGNNSSVYQRTLGAQRIIFNRAHSSLFLKSAIRASMNHPGNSALLSCVRTHCSLDTTSSPQPFLLLDPVGEPIAGEIFGNSVRYSNSAEKCGNSANNFSCPFVAKAFFRAVCRSGLLSPCSISPPNKANAVALLLYVEVLFDGSAPENATAPQMLTLRGNILPASVVAEFPVEMRLSDLLDL